MRLLETKRIASLLIPVVAVWEGTRMVESRREKENPSAFLGSTQTPRHYGRD